MSDTRPLTIGELARRAGVPVRTVRFWSDEGILPPAARSAGGYRLYGEDAVARLDLVRTLRDLGLDLALVRRVLAAQDTLPEVAAAHVRALDAEIRVLRTRRAVLASVARRGNSAEEMRVMHELAKLTAGERRRMIDDFVTATFEGVDGGHIAEGMRGLPDLPDEPTPEQVDAWIELGELIGDEDFRMRARQMAVAGAMGEREPLPVDNERILAEGGAALAAGVDPASPEGRAVAGRILTADLDDAARVRVADELALFTSAKVERYWALLGILAGRPPFPPRIPAFEWVIAALRG
ncbi:MerR family transcriptional regulator [Actinorhabdospora filicis]|uniref:MerR family transcriptional regulator n=1 Tax=Actinorhabdospora filicis TaxID=1785913 RepID=A0A9W6SNC0_9ACTN|nr:MerR family transcriptional regulator [Actinorhabdospora filicis]GLZ79123.1 MerR family transcriptional regulator [Actinorhabdospora filicis]